MSSSWFNIGGNLSSIASNVTNFTKEVLHDAAQNKSFDDHYSPVEYEQDAPNLGAYDSPDHLLSQIAHLQNELQTLSNDNAYKNEQIYHLQTESEETVRQYDTHFENLKQNLLEKEKEIELYSQKYYELESKLEQKDKCNMDTDWDDWGGGGGAAHGVDDLKFKNECLANDLAMKEIIVNTVESKMSEISNRTVDASNFSEWIDGILQEKMSSEDNCKEDSAALDDKSSVENLWKQISLILDKHMVGHVRNFDNSYLDEVDEWIGKLLSSNETLEQENGEYADIISNIEESVSKHSDGYDDFKIANFSDWLDNLDNSDINYIYYNDDSKATLEKIQNEIREFDDDDGNFQIEDFSAWLEKVQCRIDDLEVEVINEQETRDAEEKQRIIERETLNDLFIQKQKEISLLKVELYNKSSHTLNPIVEFEQEDLMTVHEQLNEVTARCEALQNELATAQKQIMESGETQEHLTVVPTDYENIKEQLSNTELELTECKSKYDLLTQEFSEVSEECKDWKSKYEILQSIENSANELERQQADMAANDTQLREEMQDLKLSKENVQAELEEFKIKYDSICAEVDRSSKEHSESLQQSEAVTHDLQLQIKNLSDINDCIKEQLLTSESSKESIQAEFSELKIRYDSISTQVDILTADLKEATSRYELLQAAETVSDSLQLQLNNLSDDKDRIKEQLLSSEASKKSIETELNEWKIKCNSISVKFDEVSSDLNEMKAKCDCLQTTEGELEFLQTKHLETLSELDLHKEQLSTLQSTHKSIQIELEELRTQYKHLSDEHDQLSNDHICITNKLEASVSRGNELEELTSDYEMLKKRNAELSEGLKRVDNELSEERERSKTTENELQEIKSEHESLKSIQLQTEEQKEKLHCDYTDLKEANGKIITDVTSIDNDLTIMGTLLTNITNESLQPFDLDVSISNEKCVMLFGCIRDLAERYTSICKQCNELKSVADEYRSKTHEQESRVEYDKNVYDILVYVINSIDNVLPEDRKRNIIVNDALCSTDLSDYVSYIQSMEEYIRNINETKEVKSHHQEVMNIENLLQMEKVAKEECLSKVDLLNTTIEEYKDTVENLKLKLKEAAELQKAEQSKQTSASSGSEKGGMKFGAMKRKLTDLEALNQSLAKENEELKKNDGGSSSDTAKLKTLQNELSDKIQECECYQEECKILKSSILEIQQQITVTDESSVASRHHQEQLHNVSLMLTERNEEIEKYKQETNNLKSRLLEVENELSDLELIREECKQLKAMLVGKEHQSKVDDTILMLQQESKQLKQILSEKDLEVQHMQNAVLEKENELSNMDLIREECKQLKQMLVTEGADHTSRSLSSESAELKAKDAEIVELRNSNSDMELLREECRQLKQMLLDNSSNSHIETESKDSNEEVSCQLLEAMLEDRDIQISQKDSTILELQSKILELNAYQDKSLQEKEVLVGNVSERADNTGHMSTVEAESLESSFLQQIHQLEEFIKEKDEELRNKERELEAIAATLNEKETIVSDFASIQNEYKMLKSYLAEKEEVLNELQSDLDNANIALQQKNNEMKVKDGEIHRLNEEVSESMAQDETMHILQTEYRNVEEQLQQAENNLKRSEAELHKAKESLLETENECERLKLYVDQHNQLSITLKQRDEELSLLKLQTTENSIKESDTVNHLHQQLAKLNTSLHESEQKCDELLKMLDQKKVELENVNNDCSHLKNDIAVLKKEYHEKSKIERETYESEKETLLQLCSDKEGRINSLESDVLRLEAEVSKYMSETGTMKNQLNAQEEEMWQLQTSVDERLQEINMKTITISQLESEVTALKEYQDQVKVDSSKAEEPIECRNCSYLDTERKMIIMILKNIEKILDSPEHQNEVEYSIIEHLSMIEKSLKNLLKDIHRKVGTSYTSGKSELPSYNLNINENESVMSIWKTFVTTLKNEEEENISKTEEQDKVHSLKIQDLQSQIAENNEIQTLYQTKCLEYKDLEEQLLQLQNINKEQIQKKDSVAKAKYQEELEVLRTELERNSHSYLNKNKECDKLKLELLQLEETVYQLKLEIGKLKGYEKTASSLEATLSSKDMEIQQLKSVLEDKEVILGSSKREKQFLDELLKEKEQLLKEKEHLEKEREELLFHKEQNDRLVTEKEVLLRHKDVTLKELEARTKRELERLRNHMMMTEESHTKDILELQEREEALQQELEDAKQGLSKKSIILQDSSKQFQDHCVDLEDQLHILSSQRDSTLMELSKCQDQICSDAAAIYNLQNALEQLQKEKIEQSDYLASLVKRKEVEYEARIEELTEELNKLQGAMSEASLAVQGINKLNLELQQKENELKVSKEKANELVALLREMELEHEKILEAVDQKLDKSLLRNLLMKYFESPVDKRADILRVLGGLLGWSAEEIQQLGSGAAPSKLGGWINNVWAYGAPKRSGSISQNQTPAGTPVYDTNKSFSELFVNFLENETTSRKAMDTASLTLNNDVSPTIPMFVPPSTPDILVSHSNSQDQRIPAPGQEIPRVHTHHAQSTLKSILTTTPY